MHPEFAPLHINFSFKLSFKIFHPARKSFLTKIPVCRGGSAATGANSVALMRRDSCSRLRKRARELHISLNISHLSRCKIKYTGAR